MYYGRCANGECWFSSEIINKMAILKGQAFCNSWSRDQLFVNTTTIHFGKVIFVGTKKSISKLGKPVNFQPYISKVAIAVADKN